MRTYVTRTPAAIQRLYPDRLWRMDDDHGIYLTFDDGPIPEVTPWVLDQLDQHGAKATFFCIGANIDRHPDIYNDIIRQGHSVGNHTYDHLNGFKTSEKAYLENVNNCQSTMDGRPRSEARKLFRPPYGRMSSAQAKALTANGFTHVMWDVLSGDFDQERDGSHCLKLTLKWIRPGSILVMHDSLKAQERLKVVLPGVLGYAREKGWNCKALW